VSPIPDSAVIISAGLNDDLVAITSHHCCYFITPALRVLATAHGLVIVRET
jgi:hypothetical protein